MGDFFSPNWIEITSSGPWKKRDSPFASRNVGNKNYAMSNTQKKRDFNNKKRVYSESPLIGNVGSVSIHFQSGISSKEFIMTTRRYCLSYLPRHLWAPLCEMCPNIELFLVRDSRVRTEYRETRSISPYSVRMQENTDQKNSVFGNFSRSALDWYCTQWTSLKHLQLLELNTDILKFYWMKMMSQSF